MRECLLRKRRHTPFHFRRLYWPQASLSTVHCMPISSACSAASSMREVLALPPATLFIAFEMIASPPPRRLVNVSTCKRRSAAGRPQQTAPCWCWQRHRLSRRSTSSLLPAFRRPGRRCGLHDRAFDSPCWQRSSTTHEASQVNIEGVLCRRITIPRTTGMPARVAALTILFIPLHRRAHTTTPTKLTHGEHRYGHMIKKGGLRKAVRLHGAKNFYSWRA